MDLCLIRVFNFIKKYCIPTGEQSFFKNGQCSDFLTFEKYKDQ